MEFRPHISRLSTILDIDETEDTRAMDSTLNFSSASVYNLSVLPSNSTECRTFESWDWLFTYQPIFLWFIFVLGLIENLFVLGVFCLHKARCTVAEVYFGNLAAADLLLISGLPFWAIFITNQFSWPFGQFLCQAVNTVIYVNLNASIYFLMMVSIDRYLALVKTMSIGRMRRPFCAKLNCLVIWVFAFLLSLPTMIYRKEIYVAELNTTACILVYPSTDWRIASHMMLNIPGFLLPLTIIAFCTFQIIKVLQNNAMQKFKEIQTERKASTLMLVVLLMFIICWFPFQIVTFLDTLFIYKVISGCTTDNIISIATQISTYFAYSNSCLNPLLYVIVGNHFRKKSREVYEQWFSRGHRRKSVSATLPTDFFSLENLRTSISIARPKNRIIFENA
ncbi:B2 bradykinin receptor isoform X1 [Pleurodeles waltl]|uniref:B2 bradykinin receptor isoform X1 n=2 Tax=Pleurodeles waltl TaxID=8319 RepID=UPI003709478D